MATNRLRYEVDINARDGVRELERLGEAGKEAGQDIEKGLEDAESASKKAQTAIKAMAKAFDSELRDAASAADALGRALGPELTARTDVDQVVLDLRKMGVTFDEIRADADQFATTLREVDGIRLQQVNDGLDRTKTALDGTRESGNQSRSVLANLAGNAAQDLGQLGGVVGSLGVGIGQLAEYAVDGNIKLSQLASVAGPMAALSAALFLVQSAQAKIAAQEAFDAAQVEKYRDAVDDLGPGLDAVEQRLQDIGELAPEDQVNTFSKLGRLLTTVATDFGTALLPAEELGTEITNMASVLGSLGFTYADVAQLIAGGSGELERFKEQLENTAAAEGLTGPIIDFLTKQQAAYATSIGTTSDELDNQADIQRAAADEAAFYALSMGEVTAAMSKNTVEVGRAEVFWNRLLPDLKDGRVDTEKGAEAWNILRDELGLTNAEMAEMTQDKLNEKLQDDATAAEEAADKIVEVRDALADAQAAADEYQRTVSGADWGATSFEAAGTVMSGYLDQLFKAGDTAAANEEAYDGMAESLTAADEAGLSYFESMTKVDSPEGRAVRSSMRDLANNLIPQIQEAYDDADGDQQKFYDNMADVGTRTLAEMQTELGLTADEANFLAQQIGLTPEMVRTTFEMIGIEEAKLKLDLLSGYIDDLPKDVETTVTQQILLGDYVGALATVQNYYTRTGATIPVDADVSAALQAIQTLQAAIRVANITVGVASGSRSVAPASATATATGRAAAPAAVPASAGVPYITIQPAPIQLAPNITIQAAVIGNRNEVDRVVSKALRRHVRLNGSRN